MEGWNYSQYSAKYLNQKTFSYSAEYKNVESKMKVEYMFKKAGSEDIDKFFVLFSKSIKTQFPEYSEKTQDNFLEKEYSPESIKIRIEEGSLYIYLAYFESEIVGYVVTMDLAGGVCLANWVAVADEYQHKGVASKLLEMWENDAKNHGVHKLHLWTDKRNLEFYKKIGFEYAGMIPDNFYGADDYLFYKSIKKPDEKDWVN